MAGRPDNGRPPHIEYPITMATLHFITTLIIMANQSNSLLRLPRVISMTGMSKSTIYARISEGTFPKQISIGPRSVAWVDYDIQKWIAEQVSAARG